MRISGFGSQRGDIRQRSRNNRLRAQLLEFFTTVERVLNLSKKGLVMLLIGHQAPAAIRRSGAGRIGTTGARRSRRRLTVQGRLRLMLKRLFSMRRMCVWHAAPP